MNNDLKLLIKNIPSAQLEVAYSVDSGAPVKWIPIMEFGEFEITLGLTTDAAWMFSDKQGVMILDESWKYLRLIVLLEQSKDTLSNTLKESLSKYEIFIDPQEVFPFSQIVKIGLKQQSDYWVRLAVSWYTELPFMTQNELINLLYEIENAQWASQELRHRVKKIIRKYHIEMEGTDV